MSFVERLSPADKLEYEQLSLALKSQGELPNRERRLKTFEEELDEIKRFASRGDDDDVTRALVCGIFWFDGGICLNTQQFRDLLGRSKSAINTALAKLGYGPFNVREKAEEQRRLLELLPILKQDVAASRHWTIRLRTEPEPTSEKAVELEKPVTTVKEPPKCCYGCTCGCTCQPGDENTNCKCCFPRGLSFGRGACPCADAIWERED